MSGGRTGEQLAILREAGNETAGRKEKLAVLDTHEAVQTIRVARRVMAERGRELLMPLAVGGAKPLIAVKRLAAELAVAAAKIFAEAIKAVQIRAVFRRLPTGNQHPFFLFRMTPVAGINCVGRVRRSGRDEKPLLLAGLPVVFQMAVAAGAFVAKIAGINTVALGHKRDAIRRGNFIPVHAFVAAVPDAENNPPLGGTVHLHSEISAMPAAGLEVSPQRSYHAGHFAIKRIYVREPGSGINEMHRGGIAARSEIEMRVGGGGTVEHERLKIARRLACRVQRFERELSITRRRNIEHAKISLHQIVAHSFDGRRVKFSGHGEA